MNRRDFFRLLGNRAAEGKELKRQKYGKISRRQLLAITGISAVSIVLLHQYNRQNLAETIEFLKNHQKTFGTLAKPAYKLVCSVKSRFPSLDEYLLSKSSAYEALAESHIELDDLENKLDNYEKELSEIMAEYEGIIDPGELMLKLFGSDDNRYIFAMQNVMKIMESLREIYTSNLIGTGVIGSKFKENDETALMCKKPISENEAIYGDFMDTGKNIFEKITGKKFPEIVAVRIEKYNDDSQFPRYDLKNHTITLYDRGYEVTLASFFHEDGHMCYQGHEALSMPVLNPGSMLLEMLKHDEALDQTKTLEESTSYLFEIAGTQEVAVMYPQLGEMIQRFTLLGRLLHIADYNNGSDDEHAKGWAMTEALLEYFDGDYAKAYNFTCTKNQFAQLPKEVLATYESFRVKLPFDRKSITQELTRYSDRLTGLQEHAKKLLNKYGEGLVPIKRPNQQISQ